MDHILFVGINAKYIHSNLAIRCLKSACEQHGVFSSIKLCEYTINQPYDEILHDLARRNPSVIGFSCYIFNIDLVLRLTGALRKLLPDCVIILGGPEAYCHTSSLLQAAPEIDYIVKGEGERPLAGLLKVLETGGDPSAVFSLACRRDNKIHETACLPLPVSETLPFFYTKQDLQELTHKIVYFESSRGCPFRCSYCLSSIDKQLRFFELEGVFSQLRLFLEHKVSQVKFIDRTFNCNPERAAAIWEYVREHDNGVTNFHFEIAADLLDERLFQCLESMRPGLVQLEIGVQSTNPDTLNAIHRKTDWPLVHANAERLLKRQNIHVHLDLIAGLPKEDYRSFTCSFNDVYALRPHQLQLGFLKVLHGSQMEADARQYGVLSRSFPPYEVLQTNSITFEELGMLKRAEALVDRLYNSGRFQQTLAVIEPVFPDPYAFYDSFGSFLSRRNLNPDSLGKYGLYEQLLSFCASAAPECLPVLREAMKYDIYARERARILPPFLELPSTKQNDDVIKALFSALAPPHNPDSCHIERFSYGYVCFDYGRRDLYGNAEACTFPL